MERRQKYWFSGNRQGSSRNWDTTSFLSSYGPLASGQEPVKPSRHGRRRSYYYNETVMGCRARLVPLLELNQLAPASSWLDSIIPVL